MYFHSLSWKPPNFKSRRVGYGETNIFLMIALTFNFTSQNRCKISLEKSKKKYLHLYGIMRIITEQFDFFT